MFMLAQDNDRDRARSTAEDPNGRVSDGPARQRKIIHIDMDAFYASVKQRDNPELRGKPVAVGGSRERGVVAAASYEARAFGVHSAMPSVTAKRKCPDLIFVKPRFDVYRMVSLQIRAIFAEYTAIIEPLSLDEACLDVTENLKGIVSATQIAETIRARIRTETGLTASAGVSYNKFLAKLASDHRKPDGLFVITPKRRWLWRILVHCRYMPLRSPFVPPPRAPWKRQTVQPVTARAMHGGLVRFEVAAQRGLFWNG